MMYHAVIIVDDFTPEKLEQIRKSHSGKILCLKQLRGICTDEESDYEHSEEKDYELRLESGIVLEMRKEKDCFEINILLNEHKNLYIHSKKIFLASYDKITENKTISLYEVLWAAGVRLDSISLIPVIDENEETSLKGMYYVEEKRAG